MHKLGRKVRDDIYQIAMAEARLDSAGDVCRGCMENLNDNEEKPGRS